MHLLPDLWGRQGIQPEKLVKNIALVNVLAEFRRLIDRQPDSGDDDHSNGGVDYKDDGKRKGREE